MQKDPKTAQQEITNRFQRTHTDGVLKDVAAALVLPDEARESEGLYPALREDTYAQRATIEAFKHVLENPQTAADFAISHLDPCLKKPKTADRERPPDGARLNGAGLRNRPFDDRATYGRKFPGGPQDPFANADLDRLGDSWVRGNAEGLRDCYRLQRDVLTQYSRFAGGIVLGGLALQGAVALAGGFVAEVFTAIGFATRTAQGLILGMTALILLILSLSGLVATHTRGSNRQGALAVGMRTALERNSRQLAGRLAARETLLSGLIAEAVAQKVAAKSAAWARGQSGGWISLKTLWDRTARYLKDAGDGVQKMHAIRQNLAMAAFRGIRDQAHFDLRCYPLHSLMSGMDRSLVRRTGWGMYAVLSLAVLAATLLTGNDLVRGMAAGMLCAVTLVTVTAAVIFVRSLENGIEHLVDEAMLEGIVDLATPAETQARTYDEVVSEAETTEAERRLEEEDKRRH